MAGSASKAWTLQNDQDSLQNSSKDIYLDKNPVKNDSNKIPSIKEHLVKDGNSSKGSEPKLNGVPSVSAGSSTCTGTPLNGKGTPLGSVHTDSIRSYQSGEYDVGEGFESEEEEGEGGDERVNRGYTKSASEDFRTLHSVQRSHQEARVKLQNIPKEEVLYMPIQETKKKRDHKGYPGPQDLKTLALTFLIVLFLMIIAALALLILTSNTINTASELSKLRMNLDPPLDSGFIWRSCNELYCSKGPCTFHILIEDNNPNVKLSVSKPTVLLWQGGDDLLTQIDSSTNNTISHIVLGSPTGSRGYDVIPALTIDSDVIISIDERERRYDYAVISLVSKKCHHKARFTDDLYEISI